MSFVRGQYWHRFAPGLPRFVVTANIALVLLLATAAKTAAKTTSLAFHVHPHVRPRYHPQTCTVLCAGPRSEGSARRPASRSLSRERPVAMQQFDGKTLAAFQQPNEQALPLDLTTSTLRCMSDGVLHLNDPTTTGRNKLIPQPCFEFKSLDEIHVGLSDPFNADAAFRDAMRLAIRQDIFDSTPAYAKLSPKTASILLLPDSSLQGSWRSSLGRDQIRMKRLTEVLHDALGVGAPTGDDLLHKIGALCGSHPSTHFIDIVGVQDRKLAHSWHLDTGLSPGNSKTVLWGFPPEDHYTGCGIFSHLVPMTTECHAPEGHARMEPILFQGTIDDHHIVRPSYAPGKELLIYRDIDVLHSSPDVAYRTSVMRFM